MTAHSTPDPGESTPKPFLLQRLSLLERVAGFLSHEIRNPLNAIFLHLDIVEEEIRQLRHEDRLQVEQSLATIKGEVTRLHDLMQEYLALARLTNSAREPEDMRMMLETVARDARGAMAAKPMVLHLEGAEDLGEMAIHKPTLSRAVLYVVLHVANLLPQGSDLTIRGWRTSSHLRMTVHSADRPLLEQPQMYQEAGLKLSVAEEIIAAHGGAVEVHDAAAGILYMLTLPLHSGVRPDLMGPEA